MKTKKCRKSGGGWIDVLEDALDAANRGARIYEKAAKLKGSIDKATDWDSPQIHRPKSSQH